MSRQDHEHRGKELGYHILRFRIQGRPNTSYTVFVYPDWRRVPPKDLGIPGDVFASGWTSNSERYIRTIYDWERCADSVAHPNIPCCYYVISPDDLTREGWTEYPIGQITNLSRKTATLLRDIQSIWALKVAHAHPHFNDGLATLDWLRIRASRVTIFPVVLRSVEDALATDPQAKLLKIKLVGYDIDPSISSDEQAWNVLRHFSNHFFDLERSNPHGVLSIADVRLYTCYPNTQFWCPLTQSGGEDWRWTYLPKGTVTEVRINALCTTKYVFETINQNVIWILWPPTETNLALFSVNPGETGCRLDVELLEEAERTHIVIRKGKVPKLFPIPPYYAYCIVSLEDSAHLSINAISHPDALRRDLVHWIEFEVNLLYQGFSLAGTTSVTSRRRLILDVLNIVYPLAATDSNNHIGDQQIEEVEFANRKIESVKERMRVLG